jgi:hypothetical protein
LGGTDLQVKVVYFGLGKSFILFYLIGFLGGIEGSEGLTAYLDFCFLGASGA